MQLCKIHPKGAEIFQAAVQYKPISASFVAQTPSAFASSVLAPTSISPWMPNFPRWCDADTCVWNTEPVAADLGVSLGFDYLFDKPSISPSRIICWIIVPDRHASCFRGSFAPDSIRFSASRCQVLLCNVAENKCCWLTIIITSINFY